MNNHQYGPMLNAYPDSMGGSLKGALQFLMHPQARGAFSSFYILPSLFHSDLDRGFSIVDYGLNEDLAAEEDLRALENLGMDLKLDFILNHLSVQSPQFQDLLEKGEASEYKDFFIDWNQFWAGCGELGPDGVLTPAPEYMKDMFFRKPGLPVLVVEFANGSRKPYWNTFYQQVEEDEQGKKHYLGQMDLNIRSPLVQEFYRRTLSRLAGYGAKIVRLDAFAYAPKEVGARNFLNEPGTWDFLSQLAEMAKPHGVALLPEIHASYQEGTYRTIAEKGYMVYDFFLPGLLLDAFEQKSGCDLARWANEIITSGMRTVNMLGCHDGIPVLDLQGLLPEERIRSLIDVLVKRGGYVKDLHGAKNIYYQVNATYYSALGEDGRKMLLARAIQLFMPGKPQVWYLDLFAGKNDYEAMARAGAGGHKEINRTNLSAQEIALALERDVVQRQLRLLKLRASSPAFTPEAEITVTAQGSQLRMDWRTDEERASLKADLQDASFEISLWRAGQESVFMRQNGRTAQE